MFNLSASAVAHVFKDKSRILEVKKASPLLYSNICHVVCVTIDGVWIGGWIY
jgi:hypothetical protein